MMHYKDLKEVLLFCEKYKKIVQSQCCDVEEGISLLENSGFSCADTINRQREYAKNLACVCVALDFAIFYVDKLINT